MTWRTRASPRRSVRRGGSGTFPPGAGGAERNRASCPERRSPLASATRAAPLLSTFRLSAERLHGARPSPAHRRPSGFAVRARLASWSATGRTLGAILLLPLALQSSWLRPPPSPPRRSAPPWPRRSSRAGGVAARSSWVPCRNSPLRLSRMPLSGQGRTIVPAPGPGELGIQCCRGPSGVRRGATTEPRIRGCVARPVVETDGVDRGVARLRSPCPRPGSRPGGASRFPGRNLVPPSRRRPPPLFARCRSMRRNPLRPVGEG